MNATILNAKTVSAPFGMPRIEMPLDATLDDFGAVVFILKTAVGPVHVKAYLFEWECRGTVAALVAGGLMRSEWCPGLPGNNKTRQPVLFDSAGPRLLTERYHKKLTEAHITVCRYSARTFVVEIQATPEQRKRLEVFHGQREARQSAEREKEQQAAWGKSIEEDRIARQKNESPEAVRDELVGFVSAAKNLLTCRLSASRFRYDEKVMAQVNQHLDAAKQAFLAGKILPAPSQYQRDGNVVYFPGDAA